MKERIETFIAEQEQLLNKFREEAQKLFKDITREFFDQNPGVNGIVWTQYSPYFNDGEDCVFNVHDATFTNATGADLRNIYWGEYEGDNEDVWADECYPSDKREGVDNESCKYFDKLICSDVMSDVMEMMFGNHVKVIVTREGFEVDDYDHD